MVFINFTIKLLILKDLPIGVIYNAKLIIISKLNKYCYIISFKEKCNIEQLGFIILNKLIRYYSIP